MPIAPFFASEDVDSAYEAVKSKINIDDPSRSRLVIRLRDESHNCWNLCVDPDDDPGNPPDDTEIMMQAITDFANGIELTEVDDDTLNASMALTLEDGIIASGGNRFENNQIALWEFKTKQDGIAFDTTVIGPVNQHLLNN